MTNNQQPLVSIIIPVYNGSNYLKDAIDSALSQTYSNIEILVINDGSTDNTEEIAKSYGSKIRYYKKPNGGVSSALNFGISKMKGEYFSWLSHDDMYLPEKVEEEVKCLGSLDKTTIIFSNFYLFDDKGKTISEVRHEKRATKKSIETGIFPVLRGMVNGDTILIHHSVFDKCGNFDENVKTTADYIFWLKIFQTFPHHFIETPLAKYRIHSEQDTQKHPDYNKESDDFWLTAIDAITESDARSWDQSLLQIYTDLYVQFQNDSLTKASTHAYELCKQRFNKDNPIITVLIPAYNSEQYLEKTLQSLLRSDFGNYEAIVIDDGSTDHTSEIISKYAALDFRIIPLYNKKNLGVAKSLNLGLAKARGSYFTRLDSDDIILPTKLLRQYLFLQNHNYTFCSTNINFIDEHDKITRTNCYTDLLAPIRFTSSFTNPIPNAPIMYSMNIIKKHNLKFKSDMKAAEDYGFLLEYLKYGNGQMLNESLYNYRIRKDSLYHSNKAFALEKSKELCEQYTKSFYPNFRKTKLFQTLNFFDDKTTPISNNDLIAIFKETDRLIETSASHFHFNKEEIYACKAFIFTQLHHKINAANHPTTSGAEIEYSMKTPFRMTYYYFKHNGAKQTLKQIIKKVSRHDK